MKMWSDATLDTALGKTATSGLDNFDPINNTKSSLKVETDLAKSILGFQVNALQTVITDAQRGTPLLKINPVGFGMESIIVPLHHATMLDGDALINQQAVKTAFLPFITPPEQQGQIKNKSFSFDIGCGETTTGGWDCGVSLISCDQLYGSEGYNSLRELLKYQAYYPPFSGAKYADNTAMAVGANAFVEVKNTNNVVVPAGKKQISGIGHSVASVGVDASEPVSGFFRIANGSIGDYGKQNWLLPTWITAGLGTVTERVTVIPTKTIPAVYDIDPSVEHTFEFYDTIIVVQSTPPDVNSVVYVVA